MASRAVAVLLLIASVSAQQGKDSSSSLLSKTPSVDVSKVSSSALSGDGASRLSGQVSSRLQGSGSTKREMPGGIQLDMRKEGMDVSQLKDLDTSRMREAVGQMGQDDRDMLCQRAIQGGADGDMLERLKSQGADCVAAMKRNPSFKPEGGQAATALKQMTQDKAPSQWDDSDWTVALRQMPGAVKADDLRKMSKDTTKRMVESGDLREAAKSFRKPSEMRALEDRLKTAYGQPDAWDKAALEKMGPLLGSMAPDTLDKIPMDKLKEAASSLRDVEFDDPAKKAAAGRRLVEGMGKDRIRQWSADDVKNADQFIRKSPKIVSQLSDAALSGSLRDLGARPTKMSGAALLGKRLKKMDDFKNPESVDSAKVAKIGHLMKGMGRDYLSKLPMEALEGAKDMLANISFAPAEAREILGKIKGKPRDYTGAKVRELGELVTGLDPEDLDEIPDAAIEDAMENIADKEFDMSQCRAIVKKAKGKKGLIKKMGKLVGKCMTLEDLKEASIDDLGLSCETDSPPSFSPDKAQAKNMFKEVVKRFGKPSKTNANYSLSCMKNWGPVAALGMDPEDFKNLPDNGDMKSVFENLARYEADMDDSQTKAISERLREYLKMDDMLEAANHDSATIEQVGVFLKHFNDADLQKLSQGVLPDVARKIGEGNMERMTKSEKNRLKDFALKNVKRDDTNRVTDRRRAGMLDDNDVRDLGNLFGGLEEEDVRRMDKTAVKNNMVQMNDKIRDLPLQKAVLANARAKDATFFADSENIVGMAGLSGGLEPSVLGAMDKAVLGESLADVSEMMEKRGEKDDRRDAAGYREEVSDDDRATMVRQKDAFVQQAITGYLESEVTSVRKRRAAVPVRALTCADIQTLGKNVASLLPSQIGSIGNADFSDCAETLGQVSTWNKDQLAQLGGKAKQAFGEPSEWSAPAVKMMGSVSAGLSVSDLESIALNTSSMVVNMGKSNSFSEDQLKAGFRSMMENRFENDIQNVTGDDLMAMGKFACGAEDADIENMPVESFRTAMSTIGKLDCSETKMAAFGKLAKKALGDKSTWDPALVSSLGKIVAGLMPEDIRDFTPKQMRALSPDVISKLPDRAMAMLKSEQLDVFSESQASAISDKQKQSLGSSLKEMLTRKLPTVTKEMRDRLMDAVTKRVMPGGIELDANKKGMDISQLKNLDPSRLEDAVKQMSESDRDMLCQRAIQGGADGAMLKQLKEKGADCMQAMRRDPTFKPEGGQAQTAMKQMREDKAPNQWDDSDWTVALRQMPGAVKAEDLKSMSSATMRAMLDSGDLREAGAAFSDPSAKRAMESQLKQAYGEPSAWDSSILQKMGSLLGSMEPDTLRSISKENIRSAASSFKDILFDDPSRKAAAGRTLVEGLGKDTAATWSGDDIKNADQYIRTNPSIVSKLSDAALESSMQDLGSRKTDKRGAAQLGKRLKQMNDYKNPEQIDSSKLAKMGQLMQGMGRDYLSKLPSSAVSGALATLANVTFPRGDARSLVAKIKGTVSEYTADRVRELGELVVGLEPEDLDAMPAEAIGSAIEDLAEKDFDKSQCRAIVKKVKASGSANMKKMGKLMSKCMSPDDLKDATIDDLGLACDSDNAPSITPDKAQSKAMFKMIKARFGNPSRTNTNFSLSCMKNWGRIAALGMEPADFEELPDNGDMKSVFEKLALHEADMDDGQTKAIGKRLREYLDMDNATAVAQLDTATIEQVGVFMKHFNDSDLDTFAESVKPDIARKLGQANQDNQPMMEKRRLKKFALKNVKRDGNNTVTDRRNAPVLDDNDVRDLGQLFGGIEAADMSKMDQASMENNIVMMNDKIRDLAVQEAGWRNARNKITNILNASEIIVGAAGLVGGMPSDILAEMDKTVLGEALADAASMMETRSQQDEKRDKAGYRAEVSDAHRASMKTQLGEFVKKAFKGYLESQTTSFVGRRRRQTTTITCSDVQVLGSNAASLTTSQLDTLSNTDFTDCTETLGAITAWSSEQLSTLAAKAKTVYGGVSTWSTANIKLIGTMTAGLTDAEISSLDLSSASVMATMGTSTAFSSTQLKAGFARFLERTRSNSASSVTGDDLITIGNFACGAETSHISSFTQSTFTTAVSSIGQLTTCDAGQLAAYATLAKTAYGATSTWDSATITSLGSIIAGLTSSEISALTTSQISALSTSSIAQIPASTFASFTTSQLSSFTSAQANTVTSSQQNALSTSQLAALTGAGASDLTTSAGSGAGVVKMSLLSVVATIAVFFL